MRLRHFFDGMLRKEEIASAFLATVLEHDAGWRRAFLGAIFGASADDLAADSWVVAVEKGRVDVRLESPRATILVENKLNAGAKQQDQLLRYYLAEIERCGDARVAAVYLAPGGIGRDEVTRVESSPARATRPQDVVRHVSWEELAGLVTSGGDTHDWFIRSGFEEILSAIARARQVKYEMTAGRDVIRRAVDDALELLAQRTEVRLGRFSGAMEEIVTYGTPVTMWLQAVFAAESDPPYTPIDLLRDGHLHLTMRGACKLAGKVPRRSALADHWKALVASGRLEVKKLGFLSLEPNGWFAASEAIVARPGDVAVRMATIGEYLLNAIRPLFELGH